jgi:Bacterial regulatory proteins, gntR family
MRLRESAVFVRGDPASVVGLTPDARLKRLLRRHVRLAGLGLRAPEAYVVLGPSSCPSFVAAYGRSGQEAVVLPSIVQQTPKHIEQPEILEHSQVLAAPIGTDGDQEYGTLWAVESAPRRWSRRDQQFLGEVADLVAEGIQLHIAASSRTAAAQPDPVGPREILPASRLLQDKMNGELLATLRNGILAAVHQGTAEAGTRLPSIREVADRIGSTRYAVLQAYRVLESEGVVETRHRSGVYIATLGETPIPHLPETARWLGRVLTESYQHLVKIPSLPGLLRRWTASTNIRCVCVESSEDYRTALADEIRSQFGLEAVTVPIAPIPSMGESPPQPLSSDGERIVAAADIIITTPFHAPEVGRLAERSGIPLVIATLDEDSSTAGARRLDSAGELVIVCVDRTFGERVLRSLPPGRRSSVKLIAADCSADLAQVDRSQPVLLTGAAKTRLVGEDFRLLAAHYPSFSSRFAERLAPLILQINLDRLRGGATRAQA